MEEHIASAADFRALANSTVEVELPESGLVVRVKRIHIAELAQQGVIPDHLTGLVLQQLQLDGGQKPRRQNPRETMTEIAKAVNAVCCALLVEPRMSQMPAMDPAEATGTITPDEMPWRDREYLLALSSRDLEGPDLSIFRAQPTGALAPASDGAVLRDPAVDLPAPG